MSPRVGGVLLILVGGTSIRFSASAAGDLVASKRSLLPFGITRGIYIVGGTVAIIAGGKLLFFPR